MKNLFSKTSLLVLLVVTFIVSSGVSFAASSQNLQQHDNDNMKIKREQMQTIMNNGDYEAFKNISSDIPVKSKIDSEEKFNQLVEAHKLKTEGKYEDAKKIMDELGLQAPFGERRGRGHGHMFNKQDKDGKSGNMGVLHKAIEDGDYETFKGLVDNSHFAGAIDSEEKFNKLSEAFKLKESGDYTGVRNIMDELGVERPQHNENGRRGNFPGFQGFNKAQGQ